MAAPERKRSLSLTPTLTPEEEALLKRSKSDLEEPDPIAQEVHSAVQKIFPAVIDICRDVEHIPVAKWSSLTGYVGDRIQFAQSFFARIIKNRCPDYSFQVPDVETKNPEEQGKDVAIKVINPSPPDKTPKEQMEKLLRTVEQLHKYLVDCLKCLKSKAQEEAVKEAQNYDNFVLKHYLTKIPELNEHKPPKFFANDDLLFICPRSPCRLIEKIEANSLFHRPDIKNSLKKYLKKAQIIHDHFQETVAHLESCKQRIEDWKRLQSIFRKQLLEAKAKRLYCDDAHAARHLQKMEQLCRRQQEQSVEKPNEAWENAKDYGEPPKHCSPVKIVNLPVAFHAIQGFRHKPPIEDMIVAEEMVVTIQDQKLTLPLFAILDGHGGNYASMQGKATLNFIFSNQIAKFNPNGITRQGMMNAAKATCLILQKDAPEISGTTLLFATLVNDLLCVFSVGDSRAWLLGDEIRALTFDASPEEQECWEKVKLRGGIVVEDKYFVHRVAGTLNLSLSASIGDKLDAQFLVHVPKDQIIPLPPSASPIYLLLASDGLTAVCSDGQLHTFFKELTAKGLPIETIASHLLHRTEAAWSTKDKVKDDKVIKVSDDVSIVLVRLR